MRAWLQSGAVQEPINLFFLGGSIGLDRSKIQSFLRVVVGPVPAPSGASPAVNDPQGEEGAEEPEDCA